MEKSHVELRVGLGKRLKELRENHKFTQTQLAKKLGVSQAAYSLMENSRNGIGLPHIVALSGLYGITTDYILKGDKTIEKISPENDFVPFIKEKAHAGFLENYNDEVAYEDYDWFRIPGFNPVEGQMLFEVEGDSMVPTIMPGEVLICQDQPKLENLLDNSLVLILTKEEFLVKRLRLDPDPEYVLLESDNPREEEKRFKKSEILKIMNIRGKISSFLIPHFQIVAKGKMQNMEETILRLQKQMFSLEKKLSGKKK